MRSPIVKAALSVIMVVLLAFLFSRLIPPKTTTIEAPRERVVSTSVCEALIKREYEDVRLQPDPVTIYNGKPAKVDFSKDLSYKTYHTEITTQAAEGPNFAGHYTLVSWGCGTGCMVYIILDAVTGKIAYIPEKALLYSYPSHTLESRMLIFNPKANYSDFEGKTLPEILKENNYGEARWSRDYYEFDDSEVDKPWLYKLCSENVLDGVMAY